MIESWDLIWGHTGGKLVPFLPSSLGELCCALTPGVRDPFRKALFYPRQWTPHTPHPEGPEKQWSLGLEAVCPPPGQLLGALAELMPSPPAGEHQAQWERAASIHHEAVPCARHRQLQQQDHGGASPGLRPQLQRHLLAGHSQHLLPLVWEGTTNTKHSGPGQGCREGMGPLHRGCRLLPNLRPAWRGWGNIRPFWNLAEVTK